MRIYTRTILFRIVCFVCRHFLRHCRSAGSHYIEWRDESEKNVYKIAAVFICLSFLCQLMCAFLSANTMNRRDRNFVVIAMFFWWCWRCCCCCFRRQQYRHYTYLCTHATFIPSIKFQRPSISQLLFAAAAAISFIFLAAAVIFVDVNSECSLSFLCMDTLFLSFDYRIRQNKYKSKSF